MNVTKEQVFLAIIGTALQDLMEMSQTEVQVKKALEVTAAVMAVLPPPGVGNIEGDPLLVGEIANEAYNLRATEVKVASAAGLLPVLSVYFSDEEKAVVIDVGLPHE